MNNQNFNIKLCPSCNTFQDAAKTKCPNCGYDLSNVSIQITSSKGISGWLLIPAIGLVLAPIRSAFMLFMILGMVQSVAPELSNDPRLWLSGLIDMAMIIATIVVSILFFKKLRIAVRAIICLMVASIVANLIQVLLNAAMFGEVNTDTIKPAVHALIFGAIWISYFLKSKRVKNTFTYGKFKSKNIRKSENITLNEIIKSNLDVFNEIERRDVVFRSDFDSEKRKKISPWIMMGRQGLYKKEEEIIWSKLHNKKISDSEAIEEITNLMEMYYNVNYPLRGGNVRSKNDYAKLRIEICDIIKQMVEYLLQIENKFLDNFSDKNINNFQINYNTPDSKLEKALFFLALIHPLYQSSKIDVKEFHSLIYSVYELFSSKRIEKKLINVGFPSKVDFLNKRLNFYLTEIRLFRKMENPHSGKITYLWYQSPLSFSDDFDKNIFILFFFTNMIWGEFLSIFENSVKKIIEKYL